MHALPVPVLAALICIARRAVIQGRPNLECPALGMPCQAAQGAWAVLRQGCTKPVPYWGKGVLPILYRSTWG